MGLDWITVLTKKGTDTEVGIGAGDFEGKTHLRAKSLCWVLKEYDCSLADREEFYGEGDESYVPKDFLSQMPAKMIAFQLLVNRLRRTDRVEVLDIVIDAEEFLHEVLEYMNNEDSEYDIHVRACY